MDQTVRDTYDAWKDLYLEQGCGTGRYYVKTTVDSKNLTVSEGHGYGMLLTALMAGHDPHAKAIFDGMYAHFREHPTATHDNLMSWYQRKSCEDAEGNDSASDGDLDIAFALLLADKQWGSCGPVNYLDEATKVIADIKDGDLDATASYVLLGDWVAPGSGDFYNSTRSSDFLMDHYRSFEAVTGDTDWTGLIDQTYQIVDHIQANHSPSTGLLPDFVVDPLGSPEPAVPYFLEGADDGSYSYNACRDPWRLGTDFVVSGDGRAKTALQRINTWIRTSTGGDPGVIKSGYQLDGTSDADYESMSFIAPLGVGAMVDVANQSWLNAIWDLVVATPMAEEGYYGDSLKLLSMIVMSGNWWAPAAVTGGCVPDVTPICTNGGYISDAQIVLGGLTASSGDAKLLFKGKLFFAQGLPVVGSLAEGAQVLVEDFGSGGSAVFELSAATDPIPGQGDGTCAEGRDGWRITSKRTTYSNRSTAIDAPVCIPGSANGLRKILYRPRTDLDLDFKVHTRKSTISSVVGPVRGTIVLGSTIAASDDGVCGVTQVLPCTDLGSKLRCR